METARIAAIETRRKRLAVFLQTNCHRFRETPTTLSIAYLLRAIDSALHPGAMFRGRGNDDLIAMGQVRV